MRAGCTEHGGVGSNGPQRDAEPFDVCGGSDLQRNPDNQRVRHSPDADHGSGRPQGLAGTAATATTATVAVKEPPRWCGRVTIPPLTDAEKRALIEKFQARNPGTPTGGGVSRAARQLGGVNPLIWLSGMIEPADSRGARPRRPRRRRRRWSSFAKMLICWGSRPPS